MLEKCAADLVTVFDDAQEENSKKKEESVYVSLEVYSICENSEHSSLFRA